MLYILFIFHDIIKTEWSGSIKEDRGLKKTQYYDSLYQPESTAFGGGHPTLTPYRQTASSVPLTILLFSIKGGYKFC